MYKKDFQWEHFKVSLLHQKVNFNIHLKVNHLNLVLREILMVKLITKIAKSIQWQKDIIIMAIENPEIPSL